MRASDRTSVMRRTVLAVAMLSAGFGGVAYGQVVTQYGYDPGNNVARVTDPRGLITTYAYDGLGQRWQMVSPDTGTTNFSYDGYGRVATMTRADGSQTAYGYDGISRRTSVSAGGSTHTFTYDSCSNGLGRICTATDAIGTTSYTYSPEGWITGRGFSISGTAYSLGYAYNALGQEVVVVYPDGNQAVYTYSNGSVSTVQIKIGGTTSNVATGVTYGPGGAVMAGWISGNGITNTLSYDTDERLTGITAAGVQSLGLSYDVADRVIGISNGIDGTMTQNIGYDAMSRLSSVYSSGGDNEAYTYDTNGNRLTQQQNGASVSYATNGSKNQVSGLSGTTNVSYGYDANGNLTTVSGTPTFTYDAFNRMSAAGSATYYVSAEGQRLRKTVSGATTYFAPDSSGPMLADNQGSGWSDYVWLNGRLIGRINGGQILAIHDDQVGRPEVMTDPSRAIVWRAKNYAFDRTVTVGNAVPLNLGFPGQYYDVESGLWNNGFRDYSPALGRYIESDPVGLTGGINTYAYVGGNPLIAVDPLGLCTCSGRARVLQGNGDLIGKGGGFNGSPSDLGHYGITGDSAAVIPSQFGMTKTEMRPIIDQISGTLDGGYGFGRVRDVVDDDRTKKRFDLKTTAGVQQYIMDRETAKNGGTPILILELQGIPRDLGITNVILDLPDGSKCPTGLQ